MIYVHMIACMCIIGLTYAHRGVAVIISNSYTRKDISFSNDDRLLQPLNNSPRSVDQLKEAFEYLKFFTIVQYDVTKAEIVTLLTSFTDYSYLRSYHRFVFAFFGYGDNDTVYCEDEKGITVQEIVATFFPILSDASRLFFFDIIDSGRIIAHEKDEKWKSKIFNTENILVVFVTTMGYKILQDSHWTGTLAKKLVTSHDDILNIIMEVNKQLSVIQPRHMLHLQSICMLNKTINLLKESGKNFI